jgi:hypothetical protein
MDSSHMAADMEARPQRRVEMEDAVAAAAAFLVQLVAQDHRDLEEVRAMLRMLAEAAAAAWELGAQQVVHLQAQEQTDSEAAMEHKFKSQEHLRITQVVVVAAAAMVYRVAQ